MKHISRIFVLIAFTLLLLMMADIPNADAAAPVMRVTKINPVPGADIPDVETEWANRGTILRVTVSDFDLVNGISEEVVRFSIETEESEAEFQVMVQDTFDGEWIIDILLNATDTSFHQFTTQPSLDPASPIGSGTVYNLAVEDDDEVSIVASPASAPGFYFTVASAVLVENDRPDISNVTPQHGGAIDDEDVPIGFTLDDYDSGIPEPEDKPDPNGNANYMPAVILVSNVQCEDDDILPSANSGLTIADILSADCDGLGGGDIAFVAFNYVEDFNAIAGGFEVDTSILFSQGTHFFTIMAFDAAGNFEVWDGVDDAGDEALAEIIIDEVDPFLGEARTGVKWDNATNEYDEDRSFIQVIFDEISDLDPNSIDSDDFVVDGHTVIAAHWFNVADDDLPIEDVDGTPLDPSTDIRAQIRKHVFIQLEEEFDPTETPDVFVIPDGVADIAGNKLDIDEVEADDWIAPAFTVQSLSSDLAGPNHEVEIVIASDESLSGDPVVQVNPVNAPPGCVSDGIILTDDGPAGAVPDNCPADAVGPSLADSAVEMGINRWRVNVDKVVATGYYNIYIQGVDSEGNVGDIGIEPSDIVYGFFEVDGDVNNRDAIFFEGDIDLPPPDLSIQDGEHIVSTGPLQVAIDFSQPFAVSGLSEAEEYQDDSHESVTITRFEIDGVDRLADVTDTSGITDQSAASSAAIMGEGKPQASSTLSSSSVETPYVLEFGGSSKGSITLQVGVDEDDPSLDEVRTGVMWNDTDKEYKDSERDWIQLIFDDQSDLAPNSIEADDFVVDGHTVIAAHWFNVADDDLPTEDVYGDVLNPLIDLRAQIRKHVFIQLEDELAPDETPDVYIVPDGVEDIAGNRQNIDEGEADDWIAPGFVVESITTPLSPKLLAGEDMETEVVFRADEDISGKPTVEVHSVVAPSGCVVNGTILHGGNVADGRTNAQTQADWGLDPAAADALATNNGCAFSVDGVVGSQVSASVSEIGTNRWHATVNEPPGETAGYFNIFISGTDSDANPGDEGLNPDPAASDNLKEGFFRNNGDVNTEDARFFEGDTHLPQPAVLIDGLEVKFNEDEFEFRNPSFIEINFGQIADSETVAEDEEYHKDSFGDVAVLLFELDGVDLTELLATADNRLFQIEIEDFAIGNHELLVVATDEAGNQQETMVEFEVVPATTPQPSNKFIATLHGLTAGEHTLRLNAVDEAGNSLAEDMIITFEVKVMASDKGN